MPAPASSARVRSASASAVRSGRLTSTSVVSCGSPSALDAGGVEVALILQSRQRAQAGDPGCVGVDEPRPRGGQREQPQRVTGRRGVEDDVVIAGGRLRVAEQRGERVKRGDLDRARA